MKRSAPHSDRNSGPIGDVLEEVLPAEGRVLEVASGSGRNILYFAQRFGKLEWQPSDVDEVARSSIEAYRADAALPNLLAPVVLDAMAAAWSVEADAIVCINMVHISPWAATVGLVTKAKAVLPEGGVLVLYGPYRVDGVLTPDSNVRFDASLKSRNAEWGIRELRDVERAAGPELTLEKLVAMPANNYSVVFRRGSSGQSGST